MDTPNTPYENPVNPSTMTPVMPTPPPAAAPVNKPLNPFLIAAVAVIIVTIGVLIGLTQLRPQRTAVTAPTPTPAEPTATPTPVRRLSLVASQSAFLQYQISVANLTDAINAYSPTDQTLNPPVIVLPLGITQ